MFLDKNKSQQPMLLWLLQRGRAIQKSAEAIGGLVGKNIAEIITKIATNNTREDLKNSTKILESTSIFKYIYIPPENWLQIIIELRLL